MHLTFLGTGSAMPTGDRFQTGLLVESGTDRLLVDIGSGALHGLARTETGYEGVDTVVLTHHHLDHVSDLLPLLKARWLAGKESLTILGPTGTTELVDGLLAVHDYLRGRIDLTVRDIGPTTGDLPHRIAGFDVAAMATRHSVACLAYRIESPSQDRAVTFSGDSEAFEELIEFADGSDVLAHDCSFPDGIDASNHPTPDALGRALAAADPDIGRVYLTHLYPQTEGKHEPMHSSIADHYDGTVRFARDGLTVEIG